MQNVNPITHSFQSAREVGFSRGYSDAVPPEQLPPGLLADALNCSIRGGDIRKRTGYTLIGNDLGFNTACQGMIGVRFINGTKVEIAVFNGSIYIWTGTGNWTLATSGSGVLSSSAQVEIVIANNYVYFFDGTSTVPRYDGSTVTTISGIPKGKGARWFHNILCVWGVSGTPNTMNLSNIGDPEDFVGGIATTVAINPNDGDYIVTCIEFNDELMIFKTNKTWSLTGFSTSSLTVSNLNDRVPFGTTAQRGVISLGSELLYISTRGDIPHVRSIKRSTFGVIVDGGIRSEGIEATMNGLNKGQLSQVAAHFDGRMVYFCVPNGASTTNSLVLVLDTVGNGWVRWDGINASIIHSFAISTTSEIYFGESGAGSRAYIFSNATSDNGAAISFSVYTRRYGGNLPEIPKKWKEFYCSPKQSGNYNVTVDYSVDGFDYNNLGTINLSGVGSVFDMILLDVSKLGTTDVTKKRLPIPKSVSYYIQYHLYESSSTSTILIRDWETIYFTKHIRKAGGS